MSHRHFRMGVHVLVDGEDEAQVIGRQGRKYQLRALTTDAVYSAWWHQLRLLRGRVFWVRLDPSELDAA